MGNRCFRNRDEAIELTDTNAFEEGKKKKKSGRGASFRLQFCSCFCILALFVVPFCAGFLFRTEKLTEYRVQDTYGLIGMLLTFTFCIVQTILLFCLCKCYVLPRKVKHDKKTEYSVDGAMWPDSRDLESHEKKNNSCWKGRCGILCSSLSFLIVQALVILAIFGPGSGDYLFRPSTTIQIDSRLPLMDGSVVDLSVKGPYTPQILIYGSGNDKTRTRYGSSVEIKTPTLDCRRFFKNKGLLTYDEELLLGRKEYWGFGLDSVPLNGIVFYPIALPTEKFPVVIVAHGDQWMKDGNAEIGMIWIAEHLASHGFIAVTVDENFLNFGSGGAIMGDDWSPWGARDDLKARGFLNLKHAMLFHQWNNDSSSPFYGRVDTSSVGMIGHSRGGGGVGASIELNIEEKHNVPLKAVTMLAPFPGTLGAQVNTLPKYNNCSVSTLLLQGAHDANVLYNTGDVMQRQTHFQNREFPGTSTSSSNPTVQSTIFIQGGNHNNWNTILGERDTDDPMARFFNSYYNPTGAPLLNPIEQRNFTRAVGAAFMTATLKDERAYFSVFRDIRVMYDRKWKEIPSLSRMGCATWFSDDVSLFLETFDDGDKWESRVAMTGFAAKPVVSDPLLRDKLTPTMNKALKCEVSGEGEKIKFPIPSTSMFSSKEQVGNATLSFALGMDSNVVIDPDTAQPSIVLNDLCLSIEDNGSPLSSPISLSTNGLIRPVLEAHLYKFPWNIVVEPLILARYYNVAFQTYEIPLLSLLGNDYTKFSDATHVVISACKKLSVKVTVYLDDVAIRPRL